MDGGEKIQELAVESVFSGHFQRVADGIIELKIGHVAGDIECSVDDGVESFADTWHEKVLGGTKISGVIRQAVYPDGMPA